MTKSTGKETDSREAAETSLLGKIRNYYVQFVMRQGTRAIWLLESNQLLTHRAKICKRCIVFRDRSLLNKFLSKEGGF